MALVENKAVFEINSKGESTGKTYSGKFVMKLFLNLKERHQAAVEYSRRDLGNSLDGELSAIYKMICEFQAQSESSPEWFAGEKVWELVDFAPLIAVREKLDEAQKEYTEKLDK
jgi:hypothetical protein